MRFFAFGFLLLRSNTVGATASAQYGTVQDAADILKISTQTVRRYISQGLIDAERMGPRLIRVDLASLTAISSSLAGDN